MKAYLNSYFRRKFGANGISRAEEVEALAIHEIAREIFSTDFPNPQRAGCPPIESFSKMIGGKHLPGEELQNHMLACSDCFIEYRAELLRTKSATVSEKNISLLGIRLTVAGGLIAILIAVGGLFWFRQTNSNSSEIARNNNFNSDASIPSDAGAGNPEPNIKATAVVESNNTKAKPRTNSTPYNKSERKPPVKESETRLLAKNAVEIDLNNPIWRGSSTAGTSNQEVIRLEAKKMRFWVKLPRENPQGFYQIFFVDEFAKALTEKKTIQTKNQTLSVEFDLRKISGSQKRLCLALVGEIPDCVLVNVVPPK